MPINIQSEIRNALRRTAHHSASDNQIYMQQRTGFLIRMTDIEELLGPMRERAKAAAR